MNYLSKLKQLQKLRNKYKIEFLILKREWKLNALKEMIYKIDSELKEYDKLVDVFTGTRTDPQIGSYKHEL